MMEARKGEEQKHEESEAEAARHGHLDSNQVKPLEASGAMPKPESVPNMIGNAED